MNKCPVTYLDCEGKYSREGLKRLSAQLIELNDLPYDQEEQRYESASRASKMSIQGVQPKLSAVLNVKESVFELVNIKGKFIIKPQNHLYRELPENEDLTMKLAKIIKIEVPFHGMIYCKDGSLSYFIKRFDRRGKNKIPLEDFAQLSGQNRDTKYSSSMEKVIEVIDKFCTFPVLEKLKLFRLVIFNFIFGNEDMHLKNFSLIRQDNKIELSPAYDLINTSIVLKNPEEIALPLNGKKNNLLKNDLIDYFGGERLGLNQKSVDKVLDDIFSMLGEFDKLIGKSFLSADFKKKYLNLYKTRIKRLFETK